MPFLAIVAALCFAIALFGGHVGRDFGPDKFALLGLLALALHHVFGEWRPWRHP